MPVFSGNRDESVIRRIFGDLSKQSVATQLLVGCVTGWCSGFLFITVGRAASLAVGVGLILLQIAHHQRWVNVYWGDVDKTVHWNDVDKMAKKAKDQISKQNVPELREKLEMFVRHNFFLSGGFAGGFFIGLAC